MTPAAAQALLVKLLDLDLDSFHGSSTSDQQYMDALHEGARRVYRWAEFYYSQIAWTPETGDQQFALKDDLTPTTTDFGASVEELEFVWYDDKRLYYCGVPGLWPWSQFEDAFPTWRTATSGTPAAASVSPENVLVLDKPLSAAAISAGGFSASGKGHPNVVAASNSTVYSTNEWAVHPDLQWPVLYASAEFLAQPMASEATAKARVAEYHSLAMKGALKWREESQRRLSEPDLGTSNRIGGSFDFGGSSW